MARSLDSEADSSLDYRGVDEILAKRGGSISSCLQILQDLQAKFGFLPAAALEYVVANSEISAKQIYGVATFYGQFRFNPIGRFLIKVCHGTACHVNGAETVSMAVQRELGISDQQTSSDGLFTLECVACLGCCSLAPVMMVNETVHGRLTSAKIKSVLKKYRQSAQPTFQEQPDAK